MSTSPRKHAQLPPARGNLGRPLKVYRGHPIRPTEIIIFLMLIAGAVVAPLGYGLWRLYYGYTQYGPTSSISWSRPWLITAASAATLVLILLSRRIWIARLRIHLYELGIVIERPLRIKQQRIAWNEIVSISSSTIQERFLGLLLTNRNKILISLQDRKKSEINGNIQRLSELSDRMKSKIYPNLLKQYRGKLNIGQPIRFGKIHLSPTGLHSNKQDYHWDSIQHVGVHSGTLMIELTNAQALQYSVSSIPNIEILLQLIEEITQI